jgi:type I restriction enzyme S subunit
MNDLPRGWTETTLGQIADTSLGKMLDRGKPPTSRAVPYLRNVNVQWGKIVLDDILTMDIPPDQQGFFALERGDLLVCEGGEIGRCAIWPGGMGYMAFQKALHRIRPYEGIPAKYVRYHIEYIAATGGLLPFATGSTIKHLPQEQLRRLPIKLPPLVEQRRIVAALEDHLSRLAAATSDVRTSLRRLNQLEKRVIVNAVPIPCPARWDLITVAEAGKVELGRQRHPAWHFGPNMRPYLRVANVFEDRIDSADLLEMNFPPEIFDKYRMIKGDILLNEGQSPELLGRPAMYRGEPPEIAFTNTLLRFRARDGISPEWALLVFRRHMHSGRFAREVRITTNIAHLSANRFKSVEFPVPPLAEQEEIASRAADQLAGIGRLGQALDYSLVSAEKLRRSLLAEAFAGRLAPQDPADEPAPVLLERIRAERAAQPQRRRARRAGKPAAQEEMPI